MWPDYSERLRKSYGDLSNAATGWTGGAIRLVDLVLGRRFRALAPSECCHRDEHAVRQVVGKEGARAPRRIRQSKEYIAPPPLFTSTLYATVGWVAKDTISPLSHPMEVQSPSTRRFTGTTRRVSARVIRAVEASRRAGKPRCCWRAFVSLVAAAAAAFTEMAFAADHPARGKAGFVSGRPTGMSSG